MSISPKKIAPRIAVNVKKIDGIVRSLIQPVKNLKNANAGRSSVSAALPALHSTVRIMAAPLSVGLAARAQVYARSSKKRTHERPAAGRKDHRLAWSRGLHEPGQRRTEEKPEEHDHADDCFEHVGLPPRRLNSVDPRCRRRAASKERLPAGSRRADWSSPFEDQPALYRT